MTLLFLQLLPLQFLPFEITQDYEQCQARKFLAIFCIQVDAVATIVDFAATLIAWPVKPKDSFAALAGIAELPMPCSSCLPAKSAGAWRWCSR